MRIEIFVVKTEIAKNDDFHYKARQLEALKEEIVREFGGLTEIPNCKGYWLGNGNIYTEPVEIWLIYTDSRLPIRIFANKIKKITAQEIQLYTIDGKTYFV